ncbi:MAG: ABC transporter ATP-binding protein [Chloroflexi bacterium]|nr:ABC transporter ATP-binding protein [Chloroflexota bacterium]
MLDVDITKHIGDFSLNAQFAMDAQVLVLFGPSGAGKSLLLNCIAGLHTPKRGKIRLNDHLVFDSSALINVPARQRQIGYVFQNYALFPHLTVRENIAFGLRDRSTARTRVDEMLALTHLGDFGRYYPAQLSGGQQQRVALARALAPQPSLLLLDEPFSALDAPTRMQLRNELLQLQRKFKIPILFVTHDLGEAYFLADRLAVIDAGKIFQVDTPGEILSHPCCLPVARAIGVKNILPGVIEASHAGGSRVRVGETVLGAPRCAFAPGTRVQICLRPERIMLVRPEQADQSSDENALRGEIVREMNDGMMATLFFRATESRLVPDQDYDLQIELPVYIFERLNLAQQRVWTVSLRKNAMHLLG